MKIWNNLEQYLLIITSMSSNANQKFGVNPMKEIMTPKEAAEYLSIHVRTIYRLVKKGEIPGRKVGGSWRFKKDALDEWLSWNENPSLKEEG
jgi:excisionase family DNA binding protein